MLVTLSGARYIVFCDKLESMKIKLIACGICEHWHMPSAHSNHCPACGTYRYTVHHKRYYICWQTEREVIKSGMPIVIRRLFNLANE